MILDWIFGSWVRFVSVALVIVALIVGVGSWYEYGTEQNVTFTVKSLDDQSHGSSHKYLVFTTNGTVYENTDAWFHGKTDSSNVQAMFTVGKTYNCTVYGIRNFLTSSYKDILDGCKQVG